MADFEDPWASSSTTATPVKAAQPQSSPTPASTSTALPPLSAGAAAWGDDSAAETAAPAPPLPSLTPTASTDADPWADPWGGGGGGSTSMPAPPARTASHRSSPPTPRVEISPRGWGPDDGEAVSQRSPPPMTMAGGIEIDDGGGWGGPIALPSPSAADIISRTASGTGEEGGGVNEEETETAADDDKAGPSSSSPAKSAEPSSSSSPEPATSKLASVFSGWRISRVGPRPQESSLSSAAAAANAEAKKQKERDEAEAAARERSSSSSSTSTSVFPKLPFATSAAKTEAKVADPNELPTEGPGWKQTTTGKKTDSGLASRFTGFFSGAAAGQNAENAGKPNVVSAADDDDEEEEAAAQATTQATDPPPQPPQGSVVARLFARWKKSGGAEASGTGDEAAGRGSFDVSKLGKDDLEWLERLQAEEMAKGGGPTTTTTGRQQDDWLAEFEGGPTSTKPQLQPRPPQPQPQLHPQRPLQSQPAWSRTSKAPSNSLLDFDGLDPMGPPPSQPVQQPLPPPSHFPDPRYHYDEDEVEASTGAASNRSQPYSDVPGMSRGRTSYDAGGRDEDDEWSAFQDSPKLGGQARFRDEPLAPQQMARASSSGSNRPVPAGGIRSSLDRAASPALSAASSGGATSKRTSVNLVSSAALNRTGSPSMGMQRGPLLPPPPSAGRGRTAASPPTSTMAMPPVASVPGPLVATQPQLPGGSLKPTSAPRANPPSNLSSGPGLTSDDLSFFESL